MAKHKFNLLSTLEVMLSLGALSSDEDGLISTHFAKSPKPALLTFKDEQGNSHDKRLVLPTPNQLKMEGDWENRVAFNPLKESALTGESRTVEYLRKSINYRLNRAIWILMDNMLLYSASPEYRKKMTKDHMDLLKACKDADETMITNFKKIMEKVNFTDLKHSFVQIYLKKLGKINDVQYPCVAVANFPWYKELRASNKEFHGVKFRKVDLMTYKNMLEYLFKDINVEGSFNVGVADSIAPFTEALIRITAKLAEKLNHVSELLFIKSNVAGDKAQELINNTYFNLEVLSVFDDMDSLLPELRMIPMLPGNEPNKKIQTSQDVSTTPEPVSNVSIPNTQHQWDTINEPVQVNSPVQTPSVQTTPVAPTPAASVPQAPMAPVAPPSPQAQFNAETGDKELPPLSQAAWMTPYMPMINQINTMSQMPIRQGYGVPYGQQQAMANMGYPPPMAPMMNMYQQPMPQGGYGLPPQI